ncbi:helix-turn-helix domain-containing protein [Streptomyces sp. NPDC006367]|uniref:helix-turn-helix domain-containing protein n=1 Tax=unclassified Streptomyces TaxID=2593676 RepID=UPI0033B180D1
MATVLSLQRASGLSLRALAGRTSLSPSFPSRAMSSERFPSWKHACSIARACGADPEVLRRVWESSNARRDNQPCPSTLAALPAPARQQPRPQRHRRRQPLGPHHRHRRLPPRSHRPATPRRPAHLRPTPGRRHRPLQPAPGQRPPRSRTRHSPPAATHPRHRRATLTEALRQRTLPPTTITPLGRHDTPTASARGCGPTREKARTGRLPVSSVRLDPLLQATRFLDRYTGQDPFPPDGTSHLPQPQGETAAGGGLMPALSPSGHDRPIGSLTDGAVARVHPPHAGSVLSLRAHAEAPSAMFTSTSHSGPPVTHPAAQPTYTAARIAAETAGGTRSPDSAGPYRVD